MNCLFQLKNENKSTIPFGRIYEVSGTVKATTVKEKGEARAADGKEKVDREYAEIALFVPEYAAATIQCHFDMAQTDLVRSVEGGLQGVTDGITDVRADDRGNAITQPPGQAGE